MKLALGRQISPFETCKADIAITLLMCYEAISKLHETWLQPQHWDHDPTDEERQYESNLEEMAEDADKEVKRLAGEIYLALTGEHLRRNTYREDDYEVPF